MGVVTAWKGGRDVYVIGAAKNEVGVCGRVAATWASYVGSR